MTCLLSFLSFISVIIGLSLGCDPPNCNNVDCGTCVEACCRLSWNVTGINGLQFADGLIAALQSGGPDKQYQYWGIVPNQGKYNYVVQGIHFTSTVHYNDTINFGVMSVDTTHCNVDAFSHSQDFIKNDFAYWYVNIEIYYVSEYYIILYTIVMLDKIIKI